MKTLNNQGIETLMGATLTWQGASNLPGEYVLESYTKATKGKIEVWLHDKASGHIITMDMSRKTLGDLQQTGEHRTDCGTTIRVKKDAEPTLWITVCDGVAGDIWKEWEVAVRDLQRHVYNTLQDCCGGEVHRESATRYQVYYKDSDEWELSEVIPFDPTKKSHREAYEAQRDRLDLPKLPTFFDEQSGKAEREPASEITEQREQNDACISSSESRRDKANGQIKTAEFFTPGTRYRCIREVKGCFTVGKVYDQSTEATRWHGYLRNDKGEMHCWPQIDEITHSAGLFDMKPEDADPRLFFEPVSA